MEETYKTRNSDIVITRCEDQHDMYLHAQVYNWNSALGIGRSLQPREDLLPIWEFIGYLPVIDCLNRVTDFQREFERMKNDPSSIHKTLISIAGFLMDL